MISKPYILNHEEEKDNLIPEELAPYIKRGGLGL